MSTIRLMERLNLIGKYSHITIKINLRHKRSILDNEKISQVMEIEQNTLTITLLSFKFFEKALDHLLADQHLLNNDALGLTDTQLHLTENTTDWNTKFESHFRLLLTVMLRKIKYCNWTFK